MVKKHIDANDKFVGTVMVYADADAGHLFSDFKKSEKIEKGVLIDLFENGLMTIELDYEFMKPVHYKADGDGIVITAYNGTQAMTFKSKEVV